MTIQRHLNLFRVVLGLQCVALLAGLFLIAIRFAEHPHPEQTWVSVAAGVAAVLSLLGLMFESRGAFSQLRQSEAAGDAAQPIPMPPMVILSPLVGMLPTYLARVAGWPWGLGLLVLYALLLIQVARYARRYRVVFRASLSSPVPQWQVTTQKRLLVLRTILYSQLGCLVVGLVLTSLKVINIGSCDSSILAPITLVGVVTYAFAVLFAYLLAAVARRAKGSEEEVQFVWLLGFGAAGCGLFGIVVFVEAASDGGLWRLLLLALCVVYFGHMRLRWKRYQRALATAQGA